MIIQYPYRLKVFQGGDAVFDESTGEYIPASGDFADFCDCRDEVNSQGGKIVTTDGEAYIFGGIVYMPLGTDGIIEGQKIQVIDQDGKVRLKGDVKRFVSNQLNSKLWV